MMAHMAKSIKMYLTIFVATTCVYMVLYQYHVTQQPMTEMVKQHKTTATTTTATANAPTKIAINNFDGGGTGTGIGTDSSASNSNGLSGTGGMSTPTHQQQQQQQQQLLANGEPLNPWMGLKLFLWPVERHAMSDAYATGTSTGNGNGIAAAAAAAYNHYDVSGGGGVGGIIGAAMPLDRSNPTVDFESAAHVRAANRSRKLSATPTEIAKTTTTTTTSKLTKTTQQQQQQPQQTNQTTITSITGTPATTTTITTITTGSTTKTTIKPTKPTTPLSLRAYIRKQFHAAAEPPPLYIITPTYRRPEQLAELTRLGYTLKHVVNLLWLVIEDANKTSDLVMQTLNRIGVPYEYLVAPMPEVYKKAKKSKPRGVSNRNRGLEWLRENATDGVFYFADDDNTYDIAIFEQMRYTKKVSMWPVGLVTKFGVSSPIVRKGKLDGFYDGWIGGRKYPIDMAGFAVSVKFLHERPKAQMPYKVGYEEDGFLKSLAPLTHAEIELLASNCTEILTWHTQTRKNAAAIALNMTKYHDTNLVSIDKSLVRS